MSLAEESVQNELRELGRKIREDFGQNRRVMAFHEYLELCATEPTRQLRSAPQYIKDCFDYYGTQNVKYPWGETHRFNLFDCPWDDGRDRLVGQEDVQNRTYRIISNFVREGVSNKLILLHGPNGSAKSTFVRCIGRGMQHYSELPEGAAYRFNWVFPSQKLSRSGIGFGGTPGEGNSSSTFAYLPDDLVDARLRDELRDHPLLLVPCSERQALIEKMLAADSGGKEFQISDYLLHGQLSHKNRSIFEALLASYHGDYERVLRHVQIERFYIQHRYREGYATVEPQMSVDASERQITADRTTSALPPALQSVSLYEYSGELVSANRGMIEYADLLKRPLEAYKYLLTTVERASVSLNTATLFLDVCFVGSSNEIHLQAFKEIPDFQSFRGRMELVRVPYLLDMTQEEQLYRRKLSEAAGQKHVAPHCAFVAALWAILTRMRKPVTDRLPKKLADIVSKLTPIDKAELYALGKAPESLPPNQAKELLNHLEWLLHESDSYPNYEGRVGASPREMQVVIFNAANSPVYNYVSPQAILDELDELAKHTSLYEYLKQEPLPGGFHDSKKFSEWVKDRWLDKVDAEVRASLGLVEEEQFERLFQKYISHVMSWTKGEKVRNPSTDKLEQPDEAMMREMEKTLEVGKPEDFRRDLISKVGAWSLDHLGKKPDYLVIFADHFRKLHEATFEQRRKVVQSGIDELVKFMTGNAELLSPDAKKRAKVASDRLMAQFGYVYESARDVLVQLNRQRYAGAS